MLFNEDFVITSNKIPQRLEGSCQISDFHSQIKSEAFPSAVLIPHFYLTFVNLLNDLLSKVSNGEVCHLEHDNVFLLKLNENDNLLIEDLNEASSFARQTVLSGSCKFIIIPLAENFSSTVANGMLKILEEPPENTFFLLTFEGRERILPTIKSRCILLDFKHSAENFNFIYNNFVNNEDIKVAAGNNINFLAIFSDISNIKILEGCNELFINFNYIKFKKFYSDFPKKKNFQKICFIALERHYLKLTKTNIKNNHLFDFYFYKKYVILYNTNFEAFLYYAIYIICKEH